MNRFALIGIAAISIALIDCAHVTPYASAPTVGVRWYGKTVIQPWPGLETAIDAALDVLAKEYPNAPQLRSFIVQAYGANDYFDEGSCINTTWDGKFAHLINGCTVRSCASEWGYKCTWIILVRQILSERRYPTGDPYLPEFSGSLFDAGSQGRSNDEAGRGAIFWEIADRLVPFLLAENNMTTSDGKPPVSSHGGSGEPPTPANVDLRNKMIARYNELWSAQTKTSTKPG